MFAGVLVYLKFYLGILGTTRQKERSNNFFFLVFICKTFVGGGPRINIKGQVLKFCVNLYINIIFFQKLRGTMAPPSPMIGLSLCTSISYTILMTKLI